MKNPVRDLAQAAGRRSVLIGKAVTRLCVLFAGVVVFVALGAELLGTHAVWFDAPVRLWLEEQRSAPLTAALTAATHLGDGWVLVAVALASALALWLAGHKRAAVFVVVVAAGAGLMNTGLKLLFARPRPELPLVACSSGFAFPSGHSMAGAAVYGALSIVLATRYPRVRWLGLGGFLVVVGTIGVSRAYLGVHFPSDVVAGWALGVTWPLWLKPLLLGHGFRNPSSPVDMEDQLETEALAELPVPGPGAHGPLPPGPHTSR